MNQLPQRTPLIVAHVSYFYLAFTAAVHLLTAAMMAGIGSEMLKTKPSYLFVPCYLALVSLSVYLVMRNGRWGVDDKFVYKGWRLAPFIAVSEIEHAQIGLPDNWVTALGHLPGAGSLRAVAAGQEGALVLKLSGNRWFVWQFVGVVNRGAFVHAVLRMSPNKGNTTALLAVPSSIPLFKVGRIIQE